jgi:FkbM family methyltransferase
MSIVNLEYKLAGRDVKFAMNVDADNLVDQEMLKAIQIGGIPEPEVCDLMARVAKPGTFVIDGGANIGFFSVLLSKLVGADGHVLSIEPGSNNTYKLRENLKLNGCENVEVVEQPLWNEPATVNLHMCSDGSKNSLAPHAGTRGSKSFQTVMLDDFAIEGRQPVLIKLDIEGAEELALRGGRSMVNAEEGCPYIVLELNAEALPKFGSSAASVCDFLRTFGYSPFLLHSNGALPTYIPRGTKVFPNRLNWNVLFSSFGAVGKAWPEVLV